MNESVLHALLDNACLLLALVMVIDVVSRRRRIEGKPLREAIVGLVVGGLGIALIQASFRMETGIVFDTRSVLLGLCGLFLGVIPTVVAMGVMAAYRLSIGGTAVWAGTAVILASGGIGLLWRRYRRRDLAEISGWELYAFGAVVTGVMVATMLTLPRENARQVLLEVSLPVLLLYPAATGVLGLLLANRLRREIATQRLAESEARYRGLFALSPEGIVILDPATGRILEFNDVAHQQLGYTREEFARLNVSDIEGVETPAETRQRMQQALRGERLDFDTRQRTKTGAMREVHVTAQVIPVAGRSIYYCLWRDITERKQAEAERRANEQRLRETARIARVGGWEIDVDAQTATWTEETFRIHEAEVGPPMSVAQAIQFYHPDDQPLVQKMVQRAMESGEGFDFEARLITAQKNLRWVRAIGHATYRDGRPSGVHGMVQDITERERAAEALRSSEEINRITFEQAAVGIAHVAPDGRWLRVNDRLCAIVGYSREELLRRTFQDITHPDDLNVDLDFVKQVLAGEIKNYSLEKRYLRKEGSIVWIRLTVSLVRTAAGEPRHFISIVEDISERRRMEHERQALETQLRQQQKLESIGTLASGVAHEINNPITGILNYAQLIQDRLPGDSPLTEFTGEIMHETQRVATIVRNLLTFARNEKQSHSPARIADIVEGTLSLIRTVIRRDDITLTVNVPEDLPPLKCRSQQIQQVLMNLMTNARDALNERFPGHHPDKVLHLEARLLERAGRRWIRLTVEDHGTGIPPEVRERMFDPFFTTKPRDKGTGLGLSISHGIVKEHHGEITVESEPGKYTRIHVDLPVDNGWKV